MLSMKNNILDEAEELQEDMQTMISHIMLVGRSTRNPKMTYQDAANVFFLLEIAKLKEEISTLKNTNRKDLDLE